MRIIFINLIILISMFANDKSLRPNVNVEIVQLEKNISAPFDIIVTVENKTEQDYYLKELKVFLPKSFIYTRENTSVLTYKFKSNFHLKNNKKFVHIFSVKNLKFSFSNFVKPNYLTFNPGEYEIITLLEYSNPRDISYLQTRTKILLSSDLLSILVGGIIGALLLSIFSLSYRMNKSLFISWQVELKRILFLSLAGITCSIITIILFYRIKDFPLPLNLEINDFYGGIIIGLFSYKMGDILFKHFFDSN